MEIKSIVGRIHDTSYGGYPYKIVVQIQIETKEFNKLCPVMRKSQTTMFGRNSAKRDLGNLVLDVNNALHSINNTIPAHNPSIDSQGHGRAKNGIKTMEFVYFFNDHVKAEKLGFELMKFKNGEIVPKYYQTVQIKGTNI